MGGIVDFVGDIFSPDVPEAPDPVRTVEAQKEANQVAQFTPEGNLVYGTYNPQTGQFEERRTDAIQVTETPFQESTRGSRQELETRLLSQLLSESGALADPRTATSIEGGLTPLSTDFSGDIARLEEATFERSAEKLRPEFQREREQLEQRLADQGLPIGSEAYQEELNRLEENQQEQLSRLSLDSVSAGRAEQDRLTRLGAALRGQEFQEQSGLTSLENQQRAARFGEVGSLLGFATPFTQFNTPQIDVADIINQGFQNQLQGFEGQQSGNLLSAPNLSSLAQVGATAFGASDKNLKTDIKKIDEIDGYNVYEFKYKIDPKVTYKGVMAQEVQEIQPDAVVMHEAGYLIVDYNKLPVDMEIIHG